MSSLKRLPFPLVTAAGDKDKEDHVGGWDETYGDDEWKHSALARPSICPHAMAHGCRVFGTTEDTEEGSSNTSNNWIEWNTSFEPHGVHRVASNHDGSIVVASTDGGTVSLLRGSDGKILATRRVSAMEGVQRPAEICFVGGSERHHAKDVLMILVPPKEATDDVSTVPQQQQTINVILVSCIDGARLNNDNAAMVAEAARSMSIDGLKLDLPSSCQVISLQGCFTNSNTIRFLAADTARTLSIHDYDIADKRSVVVKQDIVSDQASEKSENWIFDTTVGIGMQHFGDDNAFFLLPFHSTTTAKVCWYDVLHLNMACEHVIAAKDSQYSSLKKTRPKLLSIQPVTSCSEDSALAIAVALKSSMDSTQASIDIVQAVADVTLGLAVLSHPHVVYSIPLTPASEVESSSVQSADLAVVHRESAGPYAFRCKASFGSEQEDCREFVSRSSEDNGQTVGRFRLLLAKELYDEADGLLAIAAVADILSSDPHATLHASEVALRRLQRILENGNVSSEESMGNAKECLRRLTAGAVSGNEIGIRCLLDAADSVSSWPANDTISQKPSVQEFCNALAGIIASIAGAIDSAPPSKTSSLQASKKKLDEQLSTWQCIESILETTGQEVFMTDPFLSVQTLDDLFVVLVSEGFFHVAERLRRSDWGRRLTPELMASAVLSVSPDVNPRGYATLLKDTVSGLSINHEVLPLIRSWACHNADAFDENEHGLESSIFLLETVLEETKKLLVRIHSSFASYTPFVERKEVRTKFSPSNASLDSSSQDASFSSTSSSRRDSSTTCGEERPNPSVLELGGMKGGAQKSRLHGLRSLGTEASFEDQGDESDDSVEIKLRHAKLLKEARQLGLNNQELTLRSFVRLGGAHHVAKGLIRIFSASADDHHSRYTALTERVQPICEQGGISCDDALAEYTAELCGSKRTSEKAILESASISRCCSSSLVKCQVALTAFRAALLCGKSLECLSLLANDAIVWSAGNSSMRSELEEATRLLAIDGIVLRYCGSGARELFRVDNPRHAIQLLNFVCRHIDHESVLSDAFKLCDAFTHLTIADACALILQRAMMANKTARCVEVLEEMYAENDKVATEACAKTIDVCAETIRECSDAIAQGKTHVYVGKHKEHAMAATTAACSMIAVVQMHSFTHTTDSVVWKSLEKLGSCSWDSLLREFERISELQKDHSLFLSLSDLRSESRTFQAAKSLLRPVIESYAEGSNDSLRRTLFGKARRGCSLLCGSDQLEVSNLWCGVIRTAACELVSTAGDGLCVELLGASGLLDEISTEAAFRAILSIALSLCNRASKEAVGGVRRDDNVLAGMKDVIRVSSLLQDYALICCPREVLAATVSIGTLTDIVSQVLIRSDLGNGEILDTFRTEMNEEARSRREPLRCVFGDNTHQVSNTRLPGRPSLHPTWYVGDGLLLPPSETLSRCIAYCKELMGLIQITRTRSTASCLNETIDLHTFLGMRGAHSIALRMLCNATAIRLSNDSTVSYETDESSANFCLASCQETVRCLAERSLGGSGNGITSGTIDSQLAVSFLLSLPIKLAFKVYRSSLPTAITRRDFARVITLSNIGVAAGADEDKAGQLVVGWKNQSAFVSQCQGLSSRARWWKILQRYQVEFDPRRFDDGTSSGSVDGAPSKSGRRDGNSTTYVASLVPTLISKSSRYLKSSKDVLNLATKFVTSFGIDPNLAAKKHVEYLLSHPGQQVIEESTSVAILEDTGGHLADIRHNLTLCERAARFSLRRLSSPAARSATLRKCVTELEKTEGAFTDYERHALLLSLYHDELYVLVTQNTSKKKPNLAAFKEEVELIERRRDALAVLSSFFNGRRKADRPAFPRFFTPLSVPFNPEKVESERINCGVLGIASGIDNEVFDPLSPLHKFISSHPDPSTATALTPLCLPVGLPKGYIHARALIERFRTAASVKIALPTFEGDVLPVLERVQSSGDKTVLAEWCAAQYTSNDNEKLKCLGHALSCAMKASSEAEQRRRYASKIDDKVLAENEHQALDRVKRISENKSALSDKLLVDKVLRSTCVGSSDQFRVASRIMDNLVEKMQTKYNDECLPETVVEFLLCEASHLTATASLDEDVAFSVSHFRHMASLVHQGCKVLADQHSHVDAGRIARKIARRWLVHGDDVSQSGTIGSGKNKSSTAAATSFKADQTLSVLEEEEDTVNFVMDLNSLGEEEQVWSDDVGSGTQLNDHGKVTSEEEPSALKTGGSVREASEFSCRRVALRVAFVMSFAEGFHSHGGDDGRKSNDENDKLASNSQRPSQITTKKKRSALLSRIATSNVSRHSATVMEHTRELLRTVFARSGGSRVSDPSQSFITSSSEVPEQSESRKTITFAMRHRALRAASVLCPQEAMDQVIREEGFFATKTGDSICNLKQCTFGAFVAKEIEEMGLELPHSDLVQLSTMHFPSYARALWRHHGNAECNGNKGRLLLLLLEMSLKEDVITDKTLVVSILHEMSEMQLPRTLLQGCESIASLKNSKETSEFAALFEEGHGVLSGALEKVAKSILGELHQHVSSETGSSPELKNCLPTIFRLGRLVDRFCDNEEGQGQLLQFVQVMLDILPSTRTAVLSEGLAVVTLSAMCCLRDGSTRSNLLLKMASSESGRAAIQKRLMLNGQPQKECDGNDSKTLSGLAEQLELSFGSNVVEILRPEKETE